MNNHKNQILYRFSSHFLMFLACECLAFSAFGFQILPRVSDLDRKLASLGGNRNLDPIGQFAMSNFLPKIKNPVHEAITLGALGCNPQPDQEKDCVVEDAIRANRYILYGVRWPDDPPFRLDSKKPPPFSSCDPYVILHSTSKPECWLSMFNDAGAKSKIFLVTKPSVPAFGPGNYVLYRSHYGDLQFFHSMAANDRVPASQTQAKMKMWAEFLWGIAIKQLPTDKPIRNLGFDALKVYFPSGLTATNLFTTGIVSVRTRLDRVALGVLLHMVQDSFSRSHAERAVETGGQCEQIPRFAKPGKIIQYFSYANQAGHLHDHEDTFDALGLHTLQTAPSVVDVSRDFVTLWNEKASWEVVSKFFDCVFDLQNPDAEAGPGRFVVQPEVQNDIYKNY
jgi:hypothetical protein